MIKNKLKVDGAFTITPKIFDDNRGYFFESYKNEYFPDTKWIQENESLSEKKNVLRGLHLQNGDFSQAKLLRVVKGAITDIIVDLRKESPTFMQWESIELDDKNKKTLFVPKGFAHGFITRSKNVIVQYKVDNVYNKDSERCILWNDKKINIDWKLNGEPVLSDKDSKGISAEEFLNE